MKIIPVPCLSDNYAYLLVCERTNACAIVDASEAEPVVAALEAQRSRSGHALDLVAILATHRTVDSDHRIGTAQQCGDFPFQVIEGIPVFSKKHQFLVGRRFGWSNRMGAIGH